MNLGTEKQAAIPGFIGPTTYANDTLEIRGTDRFGPGFDFVCQVSGTRLRAVTHAARPRLAGAFAAIVDEGIVVENNLAVFFPRLPAGTFRVRFLRRADAPACDLLVTPAGEMDAREPTRWPAESPQDRGPAAAVAVGIRTSPWIEFRARGGTISIDVAAVTAAPPPETGPPSSTPADGSPPSASSSYHLIHLSGLELQGPHEAASLDRRRHLQLLQERYANRIVFGGDYTSLKMIPAMDAARPREREITSIEATRIAHRYGIVASEFLDGVGFSRAQDRLFCGLMAYRVWDFSPQTGYPVYVPYLAVQRSRSAYEVLSGQGTAAATLNSSNFEAGELYRLAASPDDTPAFVASTVRSDDRQTVDWRYLRLNDGSVALQPLESVDRAPRFLGIDPLTYQVVLRQASQGDYVGLKWRIRPGNSPRERRLQIVPLDAQDPPLFLSADGETSHIFLSTDQQTTVSCWSSDWLNPSD